MALPDLTNQNIQDTYQRVVQTDGTKVYDGTGSLLPIEFDENNVIISGSLIAQTYVVSQSVINVSSGSTIFGNSGDDIHLFTGSISQSGHITASGNIEASSYVSASEFRTTGHITTSGNISSSANIYADKYYMNPTTDSPYISQLNTTVAGQKDLMATIPGGDFRITSDASRTSIDLDNTATSGDPRITYMLGGVSQYMHGVDDSDSDKFIFSTGATGLGTNV